MAGGVDLRELSNEELLKVIEGKLRLLEEKAGKLDAIERIVDSFFESEAHRDATLEAMELYELLDKIRKIIHEKR